MATQGAQPTPPLEGQITGPSTLSSASLPVPQDAGLSSSFLNTFLGDKYVPRDISDDIRVY